MDCLFVATGAARREEREVRCAQCGFVRWSRYEPHLIHRSCPAQSDEVLAQADSRCVYRGLEVLELKSCETCGERGNLREVYACQHPDQLGMPCTWNWWTTRTSARAGYLACITCRLRELPDGTLPWAS